MALKFHAKQWFNVRDEKRIVDDDTLQNFYSEQFEFQEEPEDTRVQSRMHKDSDSRTADQSAKETNNEPEFTIDEFKGHLANFNFHKTSGSTGIRTELIVYGGERLHNLPLKLFNECRMDKQNIPRA